jgi:hypothetical protein
MPLLSSPQAMVPGADTTSRLHSKMVLPDRIIMEVDGLDDDVAHHAAMIAVGFARQFAPKLTGASSRHFHPIWGVGWYGISWEDSYVWYQEQGVRPFLMRSLAGKTIPMWIDDPHGKEKAANPKAKTRTTADGRHQILIFRRAARLGQRKVVQRRNEARDVPASYPGAPGRIRHRHPQYHSSHPARHLSGKIRSTNVGVRWYYPGMAEKGFLHNGVLRSAQFLGIPAKPIYAIVGD